MWTLLKVSLTTRIEGTGKGNYLSMAGAVVSAKILGPLEQ